ncbi:hypothetical protein BGAL_0038g00040 [Botrytis galanthina]|uniref:GST N-terminal domain-containing protein n=1 Tax=Botrytis galanthina TaxID=278940 RepID=A0A4V4HVN1_9HELO|nr:hypothetical protein BGAL_0038g00040 [Botrytis galanthina]
MTQPITLYSHITGPNPWKVATILEKLKIPYTTEYLGSKMMERPSVKKIIEDKEDALRKKEAAASAQWALWGN